MDFALTDEQRMISDLAREFARNEIVPVAKEYDREARFPREIIEKARGVGLVNINIPAEYGGSGLGCVELVLLAEQLGWGCTGITTSLCLDFLIAEALLLAGTGEQKKEYLGRLMDGRFGCFALTEPGAGSDVAGIRTRAEKRGDRYLLNGAKVWITNASVADFLIVFTKTDRNAGYRGLTLFLVDRDARGVEVGNPIPKLGQKASPSCELFFSDVEVPEEARIGAEGEGFSLAMRIFDRSRPFVAAMAVGLLQRCLDESLSYAVERHSMGIPIVEHQAVGHKIAEMAIRTEAARLLTRRSAWMADRGMKCTEAVAAAKAFAADSAMWAATEAVQIHGGMGYSAEYEVEKLMRDAKLLQIYEGTSEIQRNVIVRELTKR